MVVRPCRRSASELPAPSVSESLPLPPSSTPLPDGVLQRILAAAALEDVDAAAAVELVIAAAALEIVVPRRRRPWLSLPEPPRSTSLPDERPQHVVAAAAVDRLRRRSCSACW
mgnify:CR=1 FL=1